MTAKPLPPISLLRQLLRYDAETGRLFWRERPQSVFADLGCSTNPRIVRAWNAKCAGAVAGTRQSQGYLVVDVAGQKHRAHRLAWAVHYGEAPVGEVDHINGDPSDNRICNLRVVSHAVNMQNQKSPKNNKSGVMGVCWNSLRKKWQAYVCFNGRRTHLGIFDDFEAAVAARKDAEQNLGLHYNHGRTRCV